MIAPNSEIIDSFDIYIANARTSTCDVISHNDNIIMALSSAELNTYDFITRVLYFDGTAGAT